MIVPQMSLINIRCFLKQTDKKFDKELWELCLKEMIWLSDLPVFPGYANDKFHWIWEIMMCSITGERSISLQEFYGCECKGPFIEDWRTIVSFALY
jgi:hypothetical protein